MRNHRIANKCRQCLVEIREILLRDDMPECFELPVLRSEMGYLDDAIADLEEVPFVEMKRNGNVVRLLAESYEKLSLLEELLNKEEFEGFEFPFLRNNQFLKDVLLDLSENSEIMASVKKRYLYLVRSLEDRYLASTFEM